MKISDPFQILKNLWQIKPKAHIRIIDTIVSVYVAFEIN